MIGEYGDCVSEANLPIQLTTMASHRKDECNLNLNDDKIAVKGADGEFEEVESSSDSDAGENVRSRPVKDEHVYADADLIPLSVDEQRRRIRTKKKSKRTYYPMQECLAENIVKRIKAILWFYNDKKTLSDFRSFDFQIYTARYNMLEIQTLYRLLDPEAACFQRFQYEDFRTLKQMAKSRVSKYIAGGSEEKHLEQLKEKARNNPETLYLIIADEAHWGVGKSDKNEEDEDLPSTSTGRKPSKKGANDKLINCWTDEWPNVIVLLVTATGFNLKTEQSRLSRQLVAELKPSEEVIENQDNPDLNLLQNLREVEKLRNKYIEKETKATYWPKDFEKVFNLHNVVWTEGHKDKLVDGMVVKLRVPHKHDENYHWLRMSYDMEHGVYPLCLTGDQEESIELVVTGHSASDVIITTVEGDYQLVVVETKAGGISKHLLGFAPIDEEQMENLRTSKKNVLKSSRFSMKMECGEDVLIIEANDVIPTLWLSYDRSSETIMLHRQPEKIGYDELLTYGLHYTFLIDYYRNVEQQHNSLIKLPPQYLSLNFYYNSMRNECIDEKLIRGDEGLLHMLKKLRKVKTPQSKQRKKADSSEDYMYLAADYSMHILLMEDLRQCTGFQVRSFEELLQDPQKALADFIGVRDKRLNTFVTSLNEYVKIPKLNVISSQVFTSVHNYYREECKEDLDDLEDHITNVSTDSANDEDVQEIFQMILKYLLFLDTSDVAQTFQAIAKDLLQNKKKLKWLNRHFMRIDKDSFNEMKTNIMETYETYKIVNRLISQDSTKDGKMVVVRLPYSQKNNKSDENEPPLGNIFYATICEARRVAAMDSSEYYKFEIVRDFGSYKVSDVTNDIKNPQHRLHYDLQPGECEHRDKGTLERCSSEQGKPCSHYEIDTSLEGSLVCVNCNHKHREISDYEDLNSLPCILILVSKGRLGDTFPESFFALDSRLTAENSSPQLATIMQELGRLCRYACKPSGPNATEEYLNLPYALIGPALDKIFITALEKYPNFAGWFAEVGQIDAHVSSLRTKPKKNQKVQNLEVSGTPSEGMKSSHSSKGSTGDVITERRLMAKNTNPDHEKPQSHHFRILLEAEPQIGKTGVYLKTISLLRRAIEGDCEPDEDYEHCPGTVSEEEDGEDEEQLETQPHQLEETTMTDPAAKWHYPYWETMAKTEFKDAALNSKNRYTRVRGTSTKASTSKRNSIKKKKSNVSGDFVEPEGQYHTYSYDNHISCSMCRQDVNSVPAEMNMDGCVIKMKVPATKPYLPFLGLVGHGDTPVADSMTMTQMDTVEGTSITQAQHVNSRTLHTWVFTPSYKRCRDASVNYRHTMVTENTRKKCYYQHFLVVREAEFDAYCSIWDRTHVIVQMPNTMADTVEDVETGGIGYAKLFIQRFASYYNQDHIFIIDDNVQCVMEIDTRVKQGEDRDYVLRIGPRVQVREAPMFKVLTHMEQQFGDEGKMNLHHLEYNAYPGVEEGTVKAYTGPDHKYAITGMLIDRRGCQRVKHPFKQTHVYKLVLLNLRALENANIEYKPLKSGEDMAINLACAGSDQRLWVCKYNRFIMRRLNLSSHIIPNVFYWSDQVTMCLERRKRGLEVQHSLNLLFHHIRCERMPDRVEMYPGRPFGTKEQKKYKDSFLELNPGSHHLLFFLGSTLDQLSKYLCSTKGIGGYSQHLIIITEKLYLHHQLAKKSDYHQHIVDKFFQEVESFDVCTSHTIVEFKVPYVLLYINGKILNAFDEEKKGNVTGRVIKPRACKPTPKKHNENKISSSPGTDVHSTDVVLQDMHDTQIPDIVHDNPIPSVLAASPAVLDNVKPDRADDVHIAHNPDVKHGTEDDAYSPSKKARVELEIIPIVSNIVEPIIEVAEPDYVTESTESIAEIEIKVLTTKINEPSSEITGLIQKEDVPEIKQHVPEVEQTVPKIEDDSEVVESVCRVIAERWGPVSDEDLLEVVEYIELNLQRLLDEGQTLDEACVSLGLELVYGRDSSGEAIPPPESARRELFRSDSIESTASDDSVSLLIPGHALSSTYSNDGQPETGVHGDTPRTEVPGQSTVLQRPDIILSSSTDSDHHSSNNIHTPPPHSVITVSSARESVADTISDQSDDDSSMLSAHDRTQKYPNQADTLSTISTGTMEGGKRKVHFVYEPNTECSGSDVNMVETVTNNHETVPKRLRGATLYEQRYPGPEPSVSGVRTGPLAAMTDTDKGAGRNLVHSTAYSPPSEAGTNMAFDVIQHTGNSGMQGKVYTSPVSQRAGNSHDQGKVYTSPVSQRAGNSYNQGKVYTSPVSQRAGKSHDQGKFYTSPVSQRPGSSHDHGKVYTSPVSQRADNSHDHGEVYISPVSQRPSSSHDQGKVYTSPVSQRAGSSHDHEEVYTSPVSQRAGNSHDHGKVYTSPVSQRPGSSHDQGKGYTSPVSQRTGNSHDHGKVYMSPVSQRAGNSHDQGKGYTSPVSQQDGNSHDQGKVYTQPSSEENCDLTLDQVEVYNSRSKKTRPLIPGTKLKICDSIQLKQDNGDCWMTKSAMADLKERYKITGRESSQL